MVWNAVINRKLASFFFAFVLSSALVADCTRARKELGETNLLGAVFGDPINHKTSSSRPETSSGQLEAWSSDLIVRVVLEVRGPYLGSCSDPFYEEKAELLESVYLKKLGVSLSPKLSSSERQQMFRALLTLKEDFERLKAKIQKEKIELSSYRDLKKLYPSTDFVEGVALVAESEADFVALKAFFKEVNEKARVPIYFFDPSALFKILITDTPGVAAYIPEMAVLVLSKELIEGLNPLKKTVILHELVHVAEKAVWNRKRIDWRETFKMFSGWQLRGQRWETKIQRRKREEEDLLMKLSKGSAYSILPDFRVWGVKGSLRLDGFVFEKSYKEALERNDISEDLADSIAGYFTAPERYCEGTREFMPKKRAWIGKQVWNFEIPSCQSPSKLDK